MLQVKPWLALVAIIMAFGCKPPMVSYKVVPPQIPIQDSTKAILLIDAGNIYTPGIAITKKREAVVTDLVKNYLPALQQQVRVLLPVKAVLASSVSPELIQALQSHEQATVDSLLQQYHAGILVVLQAYDAGFNQDEIVRNTNSSGGTEKTAFYSVFFTTNASIYQANNWYSKTVQVSLPHSKRSVLSGLLARGPGYEANKKDIVEMMHLNIDKLCSLFRSTTEAVYSNPSK